MIGPLSLRIAGDPVHLTTARSFAGSIARVLSLDENRRHDIRLAISELLTVAIKSELAELSVTAELDTGTPLLRLRAEGTLPSIPSETAELLGAIDGPIWSLGEPWVIRLAVADRS